MLNKEK